VVGGLVFAQECSARVGHRVEEGGRCLAGLFQRDHVGEEIALFEEEMGFEFVAESLYCAGEFSLLRAKLAEHGHVAPSLRVNVSDEMFNHFGEGHVVEGVSPRGLCIGEKGLFQEGAEHGGYVGPHARAGLGNGEFAVAAVVHAVTFEGPRGSGHVLENLPDQGLWDKALGGHRRVSMHESVTQSDLHENPPAT
jgi:hypothetical protein